jgi:hypothetical protein
VYDYVIVPYDGSEATRVGHAPAADLAWRCKGKLVMVTNSHVSDRASKRMLKGQAMEQSGDVDFWVDSTRSLGLAVAEAGRNRPNSAICILAKPHGLLKKSVDPLAQDVLSKATVPVVVLPPKLDMRSRLPVGRVIACLDGSASTERMMPVIASWCVQLRLNVTILGVVGPEGAEGNGSSSLDIEYLKDHMMTVAEHIENELTDIPFGKPTANAELIEAATPAQGIVGVGAEETESIIAMCMHATTEKARGVVGDVVLDVIKETNRPLLLIP